MERNSKEILVLNKAQINDIPIFKENIVNLEIFESITHPGITGYIDILDYQAIQEKKNVFAGDDLYLDFTVDGTTKKGISQKFKIFANEGNRINPGQTYQTVRFAFCSPWLIHGLGKTVSLYYKDKYIHEIIEEILKFCEADIGFIEKTSQKLESFVSPLWSPYHTIKYLLGFALSEENKSGYLCWTSLADGKVNVATLDYLTSGKLGIFKEFTLYPSNEVYEGRIQSMSIETNYDLIRSLNIGTINTKIFGFDFDKGEVISTSHRAYEVPNKRLAKKYPLPTTYIEDEYFLTKRFSPLFYQSSSKPASEDTIKLLEGFVNNEYIFMTQDVLKINILSKGDPDRRAGMLAFLDFPSQDLNAGSKESHKHFAGYYLIREIFHQFSNQSDYKQVLTLVSDGYQEFPRDVIEWS